MKALVTVAVTAVLAGAIYLIVGGLLDPTEDLWVAKPTGGTAIYLWAALPPALAGLTVLATFLATCRVIIG